MPTTKDIPRAHARKPVWRTEAELRAAILAVARKEAVTWPWQWRVLLQPPIETLDHLREVAETGEALLRAITAFDAALARADEVDRPVLSNSASRVALRKQLADLHESVTLRAGFAGASYWGITPRRGRLPVPTRTRAVSSMYIIVDPTVPNPTARQLALVSLVAGTPIQDWPKLTEAKAIEREERAMRAYRIAAERRRAALLERVTR